jgi:hypothetical protein
MAYRLQRLNLYSRGWMNYFGISQSVLPLNPGVGEWVMTVYLNVLLETVAQFAHQDWQSPQVGLGSLLCDRNGAKSQRLLASV